MGAIWLPSSCKLWRQRYVWLFKILTETGQSNYVNAIIHLQADAVLVDSGGNHHPVHSFLLVMKFPMFRGLPDQKIKSVTLAEASSEVVELLVEMAYGSDRYDVWSPGAAILEFGFFQDNFDWKGDPRQQKLGPKKHVWQINQNELIRWNKEISLDKIFTIISVLGYFEVQNLGQIPELWLYWYCSAWISVKRKFCLL